MTAQRVGRQFNKLCGSFPESCWGAPGRSPDKKSKIEKSAGREKSSPLFCIFLWKGKDVETQKIKTKCEQAASLKGLTTAVTQTISASAGSAMPHMRCPSGVGDAFLTWLPCQPREPGIQDSSCSQ